MEQKYISIGEAARFLDVSLDTLRRWERNGVISSFRAQPNSRRLFKKEDIENLLNKNPAAPEADFAKVAQTWVCANPPAALPAAVYCQTSDVFQARLQHLEKEISKTKELTDTYPVILAAAGEIGNNSFNHNLGRWPDTPGCFFAHDPEKHRIILADRGQGVLQTLIRIRPDLKTHAEALHVAFTEYVSGRAPENRGNGLKFVRDVIFQYPLRLLFYTGDSGLEFAQNFPDLRITRSRFSFHGCLAILDFSPLFI